MLIGWHTTTLRGHNTPLDPASRNDLLSAVLILPFKGPVRSVWGRVVLISVMVPVSSGSQAKPNAPEVNRPQLDQLERLTISFIRSHVGSITYFLGRDPLPLKEPLITGFLFELDLIPPHTVTTATSSKQPSGGDYVSANKSDVGNT